MDYIEGAKVLGHILHRITGAEQKEKFLTALSDNKLIFGNAYLSHKGERLTEVPAFLYGIKNDKVHYRNKLLIRRKMVKRTNRLKTMYSSIR